MCGVFAYLGTNIDLNLLYNGYLKTINRGPDNNIIKAISHNLTFGFHRLSINDNSFKGNQPLFHPSKPYCVICNGEIYNYVSIVKENNFKMYSNSDCEVILYLYEKYGIEKLLSIIDSESFSFCLYDGETNSLFVARDRYGVRPLFVCKTKSNEYLFGSEMKNIHDLVNSDSDNVISQFRPGCWKKYSLIDYSETEYNSYFDYIYNTIQSDCIADIYKNINEKLTLSVNKRLMSDKPIGCLLSGGLDSSLICALVAREFKNRNMGKLHTFSIGLKNSSDLFYAQKVADYIGSEHHSVEVTENDFLSAIPEVIYTIESYDTTTVRASVGNYLIGKYIKQNTNITVIFNGDGSDEQSGYLYMENAPNEDEFKNECISLLKNIHYFDVLRSDRSISSRWSLESRTPFLDTEFVNYYMSIDSKLKMYNAKNNKIEKYLLRKSFENESLLPEDVLWRKKEAFSDGCSSKERSWHKIIQEHVNTFISDDDYTINKYIYKHNTPELKESYYYRILFDEYYKGRCTIIPRFWMPKWNKENVVDPSARELINYNQ
jgi:asparagine synthase (glutamine-hydrolysing)